MGGLYLQCVRELKTPTINSASCSSSIHMFPLLCTCTIRHFIVVLYSKSYISPRQAHLLPLLMSADVRIKNLHMWYILCSKHKYTGGIHLILVAQYFIKQVAFHRPANSVDLALAVRRCKLFGQTVHIIPTYTQV